MGKEEKIEEIEEFVIIKSKGDKEKDKKKLDEFLYIKEEQEYIHKLIMPFIIKNDDKPVSFYITKDHRVMVLDGDDFILAGKIRGG